MSSSWTKSAVAKASVFGAKADYLDKQVSKGVLGQTMTTDNGSSLSQATIDESVRHDIARADARQTAITAKPSATGSWFSTCAWITAGFFGSIS